MNEHEAARIAAATNALRPDWPTTSLLTLITKKLYDRPRRDVAVALAWVACETNTSTPARVLENGPWWQAAAVETGPNGHQHVAKVYGSTEGDPREVCGICGLHRTDCTRRAATNGHGFRPRTECLPPVERTPWSKPGLCGAGHPDHPCRQLNGHDGAHDNPAATATEEPTP